jgi:predicted AAA+ superfamily ATPase
LTHGYQSNKIWYYDTIKYYEVDMFYLQRILEKFLSDTVDTRPLVYLNGMRQCGKSTFVQNLSPEPFPKLIKA